MNPSSLTLFYPYLYHFTFLFTAERVYTVHATDKHPRYTAYRICLVFLLGFGVVISSMTWGRIAFIRDGTTHSFPFTEHVMDGSDYACVIGINRPAYVLQPPPCTDNH